MNVPMRAYRFLAGTVRLASSGAGAAWFTSIMGTGIFAVCAAVSPIPVPGGGAVGAVLWSADTALFALFALLWIAIVLRSPRGFAAVLSDPVGAQMLGAPPIACFTIAVGFLKIGEAFLPRSLCVGAAQTLFAIGAAASVASVFAVPYLMFTRHELSTEKMYGTWLLPVVPPIVASVPAALLNATWPAAIRGDMLAVAYALLGIGMILAAIIIVIFYSRLTIHKVPEGSLVTTMWLVVGPLGQSIAGLVVLGETARVVWPEFGPGLAAFALGYGVLVWGFAMYWLAMSLALTVRAVRKNMPFNLSWWAFTFPVGVLTAGTDALYARTHAHVFGIASLGLLALLAAMWALVAAKTLFGAYAAVAASLGVEPAEPAPAVLTSV